MAAGTGLYRVSLPVAARTPMRNSFPVGLGWGYNAVNNLQYAGTELVTPNDRVELRMFTNGVQVFTDAQPWVWAAGMEITGSLAYEAA